MNRTVLLSVLSVTCWALAGNASRLALHAGFVRIGFFDTYEYFGPNCLGSFAIGWFGAFLPPESDIPLSQRGLCVGFCGSFTTLSSWVLSIVNQGTAGAAFEELISGLTMPFIFCLIGRDMGHGMREVLAKCQQCCQRKRANSSSDFPSPSLDTLSEPYMTEEEKARYTCVTRTADIVFLVVSAVAAIVVPIVIQVRINQGHIHTVFTNDLRAVALGPAGAVCRYFLSLFFNKRAPWKQFPVGTLLANGLGTFLVVFMDNYAHRSPHNPWFWIVANGVCGALSTVSSFVNEIVGFYAAGRTFMAFGYAITTTVLCVVIGAIGRRGNYN